MSRTKDHFDDVERRRLEDKKRSDSYSDKDYELDRGRGELLAMCRSADPCDYRKWLDGFISNGGKISNGRRYDYNLRDTFYVLENDANIVPLCGARSVSLIVLQGVKVYNADDCGHIELFYMDGFKASEPDHVPSFNNAH